MVRPREFDEATVVQQAMRVFWEKGYERTSVQDLVEATGLQRGSLYGAFGDKHGLYLAALDNYCDTALATFRQLVADASDPVEAVRTLVRTRGVERQADETARLGCMVGNACSEVEADDAETRARLERFAGAMKREMAKALRQGQERGTFDRSRDADGVATFIQCALQGMTLLGKVRPAPEEIKSALAELLRVLD